MSRTLDMIVEQLNADGFHEMDSGRWPVDAGTGLLDSNPRDFIRDDILVTTKRNFFDLGYDVEIRMSGHGARVMFVVPQRASGEWFAAQFDQMYQRLMRMIADHDALMARVLTPISYSNG